MKKIFLLFFSFFSLTTLSAQQLQPCAKSTFWIIEDGNSFLTIELVGKVKKTDHSNLVAVGNNVLQYLIVEKPELVDSKSKNNKLQILIKHATNELQYISEQLGAQLDGKLQKTALVNGEEVLLWSYAMPDGMNKDVTTQVFVSKVINNKLFSLSSPQFKGKELEKVQDFLFDTMVSVQAIKKKKQLYKLCDQ